MATCHQDAASYREAATLRVEPTECHLISSATSSPAPLVTSTPIPQQPPIPFNRAYSMPVANPVSPQLFHPCSSPPPVMMNANYASSSSIPMIQQLHTQSLPNIYANASFSFPPPPPSVNGFHKPPSSPPFHQQQSHSYPPNNQLAHSILPGAPVNFVPATPPNFHTTATTYNIAPLSAFPISVTNPPSTITVSTGSPRKIPTPGSAVALEAGGDSQATLVDDTVNHKPWFSKMVNAVSSLGTVWSKDVSKSVPNSMTFVNSGSYPSNIYAPSNGYPGYGMPPTIVTHNSSPTHPSQYLAIPEISVAIHSSHSMSLGDYQYGGNVPQPQQQNQLVKQHVPGMGTYNGFSKVHPSLRHYQQRHLAVSAPLQQNQTLYHQPELAAQPATLTESTVLNRAVN